MPISGREETELPTNSNEDVGSCSEFMGGAFFTFFVRRATAVLAHSILH